MKITDNPNRIGRFTSSEIGRLMTVAKNGKGWGSPALSYIEEKNMERRLGRCLNVESNARNLSWGKLLEEFCFQQLGTEYKLASMETLSHPTIDCWSGSPDLTKYDGGGTVVDIKCPATLKSFCQLVDGGTVESFRENHKEGDTYYWQIVSNSILTNSKYGELIVFVPLKSELEKIRELVSNLDGNQNAVAWIAFAEDDQLPYLLDGGHYRNLNIIRFEIPQSDKDALTDKVLLARKELIENIKPTLA